MSPATLLEHSARLQGWADWALTTLDACRTEVAEAYAEVQRALARTELAGLPVERLAETTEGAVRADLVAAQGIRTVAQVLDASDAQLEAIPGVGPLTVARLRGAALQLVRLLAEGRPLRIAVDPTDRPSTALLVALRRLESARRRLAPLADRLARDRSSVVAASADAQLATRRVRWLFAGGAARQHATSALAAIADILERASADELWTTLIQAREELDATGEPAAVWQDFARRPADYYSLLGEVVELPEDARAAQGYLPAEVVRAVEAQDLDTSLTDVALRGYQAFGARFALAQRRVILGDEMGLGKTVQAIAMLAHLTRELDGGRFLVVCPASVLVNWSRELSARSRLRVHVVYGDDREVAAAAWVRGGGVALASYESVAHLLSAWHEVLDDDPAAGGGPQSRLDALVVDEAHYVKNPAAQRSQRVKELVGRAERVLFLTGTPMENRVEDFRQLVAYLQPQLAREIDSAQGLAGAEVFRRAVAPVYLRRNQVEVLTELPELEQVDEWEQLSAADRDAYVATVAAGSFMAMRRAGFVAGTPRASAKLGRLVEIIDEAADAGRKVLVFSFFRDVITTAQGALASLGPRVAILGPLTGATPAARRQQLVDDFTDHEGPAVLLAQIQAGGVGLNLQAASVVVICEPQVKPSAEAQAVARAHRMGQAERVEVHRLLLEDTVDERMLDILDSKARLFDEYARESSLAQSTPEAVDVSELSLARMVVEQEQARLGLAATDVQDVPFDDPQDAQPQEAQC